MLKTQIGGLIGTLSGEHLARVDRALSLALGLPGGRRPEVSLAGSTYVAIPTARLTPDP